jgi:hypothetical protein
MNDMLISTDKPPITKAIEALNAAFKADPQAIWTLMNSYTLCNEKLADHPTVQVLEKEVEGEKKWQVGMLGLLNGVIEAALGARVCIMTSEADKNGQRKLLGFDVYVDPSEKKESQSSLVA